MKCSCGGIFDEHGLCFECNKRLDEMDEPKRKGGRKPTGRLTDTFSISLAKGYRAALDELAEKDGCSRSAVIETALQRSGLVRKR